MVRPQEPGRTAGREPARLWLGEDTMGDEMTQQPRQYVRVGAGPFGERVDADGVVIDQVGDP
jgi:hypothetical protein